jgi:hypothetical protein
MVRQVDKPDIKLLRAMRRRARTMTTKLMRCRRKNAERRRERKMLVFFAGYAERTDVISLPGLNQLGYARRVLGVKIPRSMQRLLERRE